MKYEELQSELINLTQTIGDKIVKIYNIEQSLFMWGMLRDKQLFELTPDTGWEGKNPGQRKQTETFALEEDLIYVGFNYMYQTRKRELEEQKMYLKQLETFRRGSDWLIRLELSEGE